MLWIASIIPVTSPSQSTTTGWEEIKQCVCSSDRQQFVQALLPLSPSHCQHHTLFTSFFRCPLPRSSRLPHPPYFSSLAPIFSAFLFHHRLWLSFQTDFIPKQLQTYSTLHTVFELPGFSVWIITWWRPCCCNSSPLRRFWEILNHSHTYCNRVSVFYWRGCAYGMTGTVCVPWSLPSGTLGVLSPCTLLEADMSVRKALKIQPQDASARRFTGRIRATQSMKQSSDLSELTDADS